MFKYLFKRDTLLATIAVFAVMALLALLPLNTHVLDPIKIALQDFDYNDMAYSRMGKNRNEPVDTNLVIVNIDTAGRKTIAGYLQKLVSFHPKAIGVDVLFAGAKDPAIDAELAHLFARTPNMILAYDLGHAEHDLRPEGLFYEKTGDNKGYINLVGEEGGVIRYFSPVTRENGNEHVSFAAAVARRVDGEAFHRLVDRDHDAEIINYTSSPEKFLVVNGEDLNRTDFDSRTVTNKIVLVGFVSADENNSEDKHFTPMNQKAVGKSRPDMNGVLVHANIIKMILSGKYITKVPTWITWLIAFVLCWLHTAVFIRFYLDKHLWFHLAAKAAQLVSAILFVYVGLLFFFHLDIKINLTGTLVAIILAVDVLYFYEALSVWLHKKTGYKSIFYKTHN